jgi:O-antigen ligase
LKTRTNFIALVVFILSLLLVLASIGYADARSFYIFLDQKRSSGPWNNPNIFGLLMGTGMVLVIGQLVQSVTPKSQRQKSGVGFFFALLCFIAAMLMGRGLFHSFSRGAWVATVCGVSYLLGSRLWTLGHEGELQKSEIGDRKSEISCSSWLKNYWLPLAVILASGVAMLFWHFRQTDWHPVQRALSAVNTVDFSWRNRIAAWEGDLQMMAEHPWFGTGWNQPESLYEHYYLPSKLCEGGAIETNDYLMLGATLGIAAFFCFVMYVWLSLTKKSEIGNQRSEISGIDWLQATCRAGAIVLLVGFWFDGGLFKLPTAATFWILLELGAVKLPQKVTSGAKSQ